MQGLAACLQDEIVVITLRPSGSRDVVLRMGKEPQGIPVAVGTLFVGLLHNM